MSVDEDQIRDLNADNELDELSRKINGVPIKDIAAGINAVTRFEEYLKNKEKGKEHEKKENPNGTELLKDIMGDMEKE